MADCYCRGAGTCETCNGHTCSGGCTCNLDGAPQDIHGWANPSHTRLEAWAEKQELTR